MHLVKFVDKSIQSMLICDIEYINSGYFAGLNEQNGINKWIHGNSHFIFKIGIYYLVFS